LQYQKARYLEARMRLTNRLGLPQSIVNAVTNDPYPNHGTLSVTTLIASPQMIRLARSHDGEREEDVADRLWALYGQLGHAVAERAADEGDIVERRIYATVNGVRVSGQLDVLGRDGGLRDFKFSSVYAIKDREVKPEWQAQLNLLRLLCVIGENTQDFPEVKQLQIVAMARDWRPTEALRDKSYPDRAAVLNVPMWTIEETEAYLVERIRLHQMETPPPCTDEERWKRPTKWALMQKGRKRAIKLFDARPFQITLTQGQYWEPRIGGYARCENYCPAANVCPQWKAHEAERSNQDTTAERPDVADAARRVEAGSVCS
jgi:hypothetical protein